MVPSGVDSQQYMLQEWISPATIHTHTQSNTHVHTQHTLHFMSWLENAPPSTRPASASNDLPNKTSIYNPTIYRKHIMQLNPTKQASTIHTLQPRITAHQIILGVGPFSFLLYRKEQHFVHALPYVHAKPVPVLLYGQALRQPSHSVSHTKWWHLPSIANPL